jgi:hypothetical protein
MRLVLLFGGRRGMHTIASALGVPLLLGSVTALIDEHPGRMRRPEMTAAASPTAVPAAEQGRSRLALGGWWRFATIGNGGLRFCGAGREDWVLRAGS